LDTWQVDGSFVFSAKVKKVCKVPARPEDALKSSLMGMAEKTRMGQFTLWVAKVNLADRKTWRAGMMVKTDLKLDTMTAEAFFKYWNLEKETIEFLTHSCCLYRDNSWRAAPAIAVVRKMQLYLNSMTRFKGMGSPYLYPLYGLGELPQAFARLAAVHGGTYMLNRALDDGPVFGEGDLAVQFDESGAACGVKVKDAVAKCKVVIGDPSYFPGKCAKKGQVVRAIALIDHFIADTKEAPSHQIIFPGSTVGRTNDLYLFCTSACHKVAPEGKYLAFVSSLVEGPTEGLSVEQIATRELGKGLTLLTPVIRVFYDM
jgi:Rab GDP dissociation inhibitor